MYHLTKNKRAEQSAQLIFDGLCKCLKTKSFDQITVTDVQKASTVARTTIYRWFDNLSDVLFWKCDLCFRQSLEWDFAEFNEWELIKRFFEYWMKNGEILQLLVDINRQDIIFACHMKNAQMLEKSFGRLPELDEVSSRYFMAIRTGVTIGVLRAWLEGGKKETSDELVEILKTQLRAIF